VFVIIV